MSPVLKESTSPCMIEIEHLLVVFVCLARVVKESELLLVLADRDADVHLPLLCKGQHGGLHTEDSLLVVG